MVVVGRHPGCDPAIESRKEEESAGLFLASFGGFLKQTARSSSMLV